MTPFLFDFSTFQFLPKEHYMKNEDLYVFAQTLYGEARGEYQTFGIGALIAVANVIVNRLKYSPRFGRTLAQVCLKPYQFSCWNQNDPNRSLLTSGTFKKESIFAVCQETAEKVATGVWPDLTQGSNHYHATSCKPAWACPLKKKLSLGKHIFYRLD